MALDADRTVWADVHVLMVVQLDVLRLVGRDASTSVAENCTGSRASISDMFSNFSWESGTGEQLVFRGSLSAVIHNRIAR